MSRRQKLAAIYGIVGLYTVAPVLSVAISSGIASATHSVLDEGGVHPCLVFGHDIGPLVYDLFLFGWFSLVTLPTGILALVVISGYLLVRWFRARRKAT